MGDGLAFEARLEGLAAIVQYQAGPRQKHPEQDGVATDVKQRQGEQPAAVAVQRDQAGGAPGRGQMVGEAVHHRLGGAARSRGKDHVVELRGVQRPGLLLSGQLGLALQPQGLPGAVRDLPGRPEGGNRQLGGQLGLSAQGEGGIEGA
ncbi:hypothetical protein D3C85_1255670 [compost metagenome]